MFFEILMFLFSLTGLIFGIALTFIAPEELSAGKKYFIFLKRLLFVLISIAVVYYCYQDNLVYLLLLYVIFAVSLFVVDFKTKRKGYYGLHYFLFVLSYFFNPDVTFRLIFLALVFLYGFPVGMLLRGKID